MPDVTNLQFYLQRLQEEYWRSTQSLSIYLRVDLYSLVAGQRTFRHPVPHPLQIESPIRILQKLENLLEFVRYQGTTFTSPLEDAAALHYTTFFVTYPQLLYVSIYHLFSFHSQFHIRVWH